MINNDNDAMRKITKTRKCCVYNMALDYATLSRTREAFMLLTEMGFHRSMIFMEFYIRLKLLELRDLVIKLFVKGDVHMAFMESHQDEILKDIDIQKNYIAQCDELITMFKSRQ